MWSIEFGGVLNDRFIRNIYGTKDDIETYRSKFNNTDYYYTPYSYYNLDPKSTTHSSCLKLADLYFDFDISDKSQFNNVKEDAIKTIIYLSAIFKVDKKDIRIYFSGNKGIHITVPYQIMDIKPHKDLNKIFRSIADDVYNYVPNRTLDRKIYDARRLFRVVNSINAKTGLYKIPITYEELVYYDYNGLTKMALCSRTIQFSQPKKNSISSLFYNKYLTDWEIKIANANKRREKLNTNKQFDGYKPPCIEKMLTESVIEGQRNNTSIILASFFLNSGLSKEETINELEVWNSTVCTPSMPSREIIATVNSADKHRYNFGCSTITAISDLYCDKSKCALFTR